MKILLVFLSFLLSFSINCQVDLTIEGDRNMYGVDFIAEVETSKHFEMQGYSEIVLHNGWMFLTPSDSVKLPDEPPFGEVIFISSESEEMIISLSFSRINYSDIEFYLKYEEDKEIVEIKGKAHCSPYFYFGTEILTLENEACHALTYSFFEKKKWVSITIGQETENSNWFGTIHSNLIPALENLNYDHFPLLREK